jgi:gluconate kinase
MEKMSLVKCLDTNDETRAEWYKCSEVVSNKLQCNSTIVVRCIALALAQAQLRLYLVTGLCQ